MTQEQLKYINEQNIDFKYIINSDGYKVSFDTKINLGHNNDVKETVSLYYGSNYDVDIFTLEGIEKQIDMFLEFYKKQGYEKKID